MDPDRLTETERLQIEHIRQLDMEELQIEEVDHDFHPSSSSSSENENDDVFTNLGDGSPGPDGGFTFDTCLASLHTYLGEVDDVHGRMTFLDGGAILNLPMFYLDGVVLFPEATLPLRVIQPRFKAAVERALKQVDAPCTIGVIRVYKHSDDGRTRIATTGTTAEIRQYRQLDDGSLNVVARGQQRFRLRRIWIDVEGAPCAEVQIVEEDTPLRTPKDAFGRLASSSNSRGCRFSHAMPSGRVKRLDYEDAENSSECMSVSSTSSDHSDMRSYLSASDSFSGYQKIDESCSSDEELARRRERSNKSGGPCQYSNHEIMSKGDSAGLHSLEPSPEKRHSDGEKWKSGCVFDGSKCVNRAQMSFWPHWVYQMFDSYALAQRAVDLWTQIIGSPRLDDYVRKPDYLSFYIASKLPVSESARQELLEIDGISYRLRREIQLLKSFNLIRCKICQTLIAKRSDMVVMCSNGPLNAYVNPHGYVHEVITVTSASGLALLGGPVKEHSWFPGYAWTIANCAACESNMGWLFTATKKNLRPRSFWGIRSSQVADDLKRTNLEG